MTKIISIFALISSGFLSTFAYAYAGCNPASTCYVDQAIASIPTLPAGGTTGQVLTKVNNNNYDTKWATPSGAKYTVGQSAFGGKIFYVDSTGQHGLVAAITDEPGGANYTWGNSTTSGTAQYQCTNKAAVNGYANWFLPDQAQMTLLYTNRYAIGGSPNGGFSNTTLSNASLYWTSTESDNPGTAWFMYFGNAFQGNNPENNSYSVRCIRAF